MNKFVKRGCTVLLALTLALGMSVSAFAAGEPTVKKDYQLTNAGTTSPEETFQFTVEKVGVTDGTKADGSPLTTDDMPALTIDPAHYAGGGAGSENEVKNLTISHTAPFPNVGVYTYTVKETKGNTAGVTYYEKTMKLVVTVTHGKGDKLVETYAFYPDASNPTSETKGDAIVNTYSAGSLHVGKHVSGNLGNKAQKFNIDVTFTAPDNQTVRSTITYGDEENPNTITPADFENEKHAVTVTISLADDQAIVFNNVPYGVTYKVQEKKYEGYTTTYSENSETPKGADYVQGTINKEHTVADILNTKEGTVDTGVILHSAPYILLLVGVGAAAVAFLILKKHREV